MLAEERGAALGFALYFFNFSTWTGRRGLYLEDLFVRPEARGRGIGERLVAYLARVARSKDCGRLELSVLDWNVNAIRLYDRLGGKPMNGWTVYRFSRDAIDALASRDASGETNDALGESMSEDYRAFAMSVTDHVASVVLRGPGKGNALGPDFWREAPLVFDRLDGDDDVRAVVVSGADGNFTYGLDLAAMTSDLRYVLGAPAMAAERTRFLDQLTVMQRALTSMMSCRKPVVAAISGWCVGAGIDIICAADVRVCSRDAMFSVRAVRIGIVEDMGSLQRLPAIIGEGAARELALTGDDFNAERARDLKLVNHLRELPEHAMSHAREIAARMAANPPLSVQGVKRVMNERALVGMRESLHYTALWNAAFMQSRDFAEAMAAFAEKRAPKFEGR